MARAAYVSLSLARFGALRRAGEFVAGDRPGVLFCQVGADSRGAGTDVASQEAFTFVVLGLHADADSAGQLLDDRLALAPWLDEATELWTAVLQPFRHKGKANYLTPAEPGLLFEPLGPPPSPESPFVVITSVGWDKDGLDMARVADFGVGVGAVRASMTAVPGLHSQHSFLFPGALAHDPITVSFWRDHASARAFAYESGSHRRQMDRYHATDNADRTSFTRCSVLRSKGTWYGGDPLDFGH